MRLRKDFFCIRRGFTKRLLLIGVPFFFLFTSLWGFYISIRPGKFVSNITPKDIGLDYEEVSFVTDDKVTLRGWFIPHKETVKSKTLILLHGYPADKGNILPAVSFLSRRYNLLLFDFRYLGQSSGRYSTAGAQETRDLKSAIGYLKSRGIKEVGVWGFSLGGAVALMTASNAPEIKALVSISSYASLDLMVFQLYRIPSLKYPLVYLTGLWARIFLGIDLRKVSPRESARNIKIPVLIIHSKNDGLIPFQHALLIQEALKHNPRAEFWFTEGLIHGELGGEYQRRIEKFFENSL